MNHNCSNISSNRSSVISWSLLDPDITPSRNRFDWTLHKTFKTGSK